MPDDLIESDHEERKATQGTRSLKAMGVDSSILGAAIGEALSRASHAPLKPEPLREFVRATVCAKDDGGSHIPISFTKDELQDPSYAGRMFGFGAKVRLKKDAYVKRANLEHVARAE